MPRIRRSAIVSQFIFLLILCLGSRALSEDTGKDSLLVQAKESFSKGDCIEPIGKLHKVLELDSQNEEATLLLADSYACINIEPYAIYYYKAILNINREKYENYYLAPYANELKPFKEAIEKDKKDAKAYFGLGQVYLKKALQWIAASWYYGDLGLVNEQKKYLKLIDAAATRSSEGDTSPGNELLFKNFVEAIKINPQYAEAYNALGVAYSAARLGTETDEKVLKAFENAVKYNENYAPALLNLGHILSLSDNPQSKARAKELLLKAKELGLGVAAGSLLKGL